jgi:hypothetical protein
VKLGVSAELVADWLKVRKTKRAANTLTALNRLKAEIEKSGWTAEQAVRLACERSWSGFDASWVKDEKPAAASGPEASKPFDMAAYQARRKAEAAAAMKAMELQELRETVPPKGWRVDLEAGKLVRIEEGAA